MLLVRLLFGHRQTQALYQARPKMVLGFGSAVVALSLIAIACLHVQLWKDGKSKDPELLLTALTSADERGVAEWLRGRVQREDLVLAPPELAPWLTPVPMHTFASHVLRSFNYAQQLQEATAFYEGESLETAHGLMQAYGVRWVVTPSVSPATRYFSGRPVVEIGSLRVYEIPGNRMEPYPGLAQLVPGAAKARSLSRIVIDATAEVSQIRARLWDYFRGKGRA
jgi:hypothetical protein